MATVVLIMILATLNLGVGYVLALYLHAPALDSPRSPRPQKPAVPPHDAPSTTTTQPSTDEAPSAEAPSPADSSEAAPEDESPSTDDDSSNEEAAASTEVDEAPQPVDSETSETIDAPAEPETDDAPDTKQPAAPADAREQEEEEPADPTSDEPDDTELFEKLSQEALGTIKAAATFPKAEEPPPAEADESPDTPEQPDDTHSPATSPADELPTEPASQDQTPSPQDEPPSDATDDNAEPEETSVHSTEATSQDEASAPTADDAPADAADTTESAPPADESADSQYHEPDPEPDVPPPWLGILEAATEPESFLEAMLQAVRFELGQYRGQLMQLDERLRPLEIDPATEPDVSADTLESLRHEILTLNQRYLSHQKLVLRATHDFSGDWGDLAEGVACIESALTTTIERIENANQSLESIDCGQPCQQTVQQLRDVLANLVDSVHDIYRAAEQSLVALLLSNESQEAEHSLLVDGSTMLQNRAGLELVLRQWWREDANRVRSLSLVAVDVDHLREINRRFGIAAGDRVMETIATQASDLLRKNRGFDRAFRIDRRELILLLGDTGPHGAACAGERVRQTVAATQYEQAGQTFEVSVSCGVTDARSEDTVRTLIDRVLKTVRECKRQGGNRTLIDEGDGPVEITPPDYRMEPQVIHLSD